MEKTFEKIREVLTEHIQLIIRKGANMAPPDIDFLNKDLCALETLQRIEGGGEGEDSEGASGNSYRRGRSRTTGRYTSRDSHDGGSSMGYYDGGSGNSSRYYDGSGNSGYSGHSKKDRTIDHIEQLMDVAQNEQERQFLGKWLDRIQNS